MRMQLPVTEAENLGISFSLEQLLIAVKKKSTKNLLK